MRLQKIHNQISQKLIAKSLNRILYSLFKYKKNKKKMKNYSSRSLYKIKIVHNTRNKTISCRQDSTDPTIWKQNPTKEHIK